MRKGKKVALLVLSLSLSGSLMAHADYIVTGQIEGLFCKGFVIYSCEFKVVNRVEKGGRLHEIKTRYKYVTSYDSKRKHCLIRVKKQSVSKFAMRLMWQDFYYFDKNLGVPDQITFPCEKR